MSRKSINLERISFQQAMVNLESDIVFLQNIDQNLSAIDWVLENVDNNSLSNSHIEEAVWVALNNLNDIQNKFIKIKIRAIDYKIKFEEHSKLGQSDQKKLDEVIGRLNHLLEKKKTLINNRIKKCNGIIREETVSAKI